MSTQQLNMHPSQPLQAQAGRGPWLLLHVRMPPANDDKDLGHTPSGQVRL